jgi:hypothetical protein
MPESLLAGARKFWAPLGSPVPDQTRRESLLCASGLTTHPVGGMTGCAVEAVTVGHADGRDLVDIALSEALAPVLRDLGTCGAPVPDVRDKQWSNVPGQVTAMLHDADGTAQGVFAMAAESLPQRIASVADQVQEWAVEALWRAGRPATWPECPEHPNSHPLTAAVQD